ncbi:MAG TPA: S8 family serine peptidase [Fimbriimonadaceae bacterium]|nr:S8 family serine peptidase [Fimbriimonadaceae bacterium]
MAGAFLSSLSAFGQNYVPGKVLVRFRASDQSVNEAIAAVGGRVVGRLPEHRIECVQLPAGLPVEAAVARLRRRPDVEYAEPDYIVTLFGVDDPLYSQQWDLAKIGAPNAWAITTGNPSVLVADLDTGADLEHPDLAGQIAGTANFVGTGPAEDGNGHGTHTAGTVAAKTNDGIGVASLGCNTRLLIGKVVPDDGIGDDFTVAQGIDWAVASGAKVITMSLGDTNFSQALADAVASAWNQGVVVVAAAGNNGNSAPVYPAACSGCIAVAATDQNDNRCSFSDFGTWVHVAAPGSGILSTYLNGGYRTLSGTSMAAPHVAALAALLWANGARSNLAIRNAILGSGSPTRGFGRYPTTRINPRAALLRLP